MKRLLAIAAILAGLILQAAPQAAAQDFPVRTVRIILPLSAGGGGDIFIRALCEELSKRWGQPVIVENRPGGSLNIGSRACAEAPKDGYTLCLLSSEPLVYNQFLFKSLPYDPEKSFQPVTSLFILTNVLAVTPSLNVNSVAELVALSKAKPGTLSYGTFSLPLVSYMEQLKREQGADWVRVPFRGGGEAVNAVISGSTPIIFLGISNMVGQLRSGLIKGLAVNSKTRSSLFPDFPTLVETGYRGKHAQSWFGLFVPAGTPRALVIRINQDVSRIVNEPEFRERHLIARGLEPAVGAPEEFSRLIQADRALAEQVVKDAGLQPQ